jgi:tetratricopeptide (TPR) repeat protein
MDNFEHLLDGVRIVSEILDEAPGVKVLVTSREKLNLRSETNFVVHGMGIATSENAGINVYSDAAALFIQRARKVRTGFDPSHPDLEIILQICQIVQGMPLAIELAAAWLHILNVNEIAKELERDLDILTTEAQDTPERQRSIRAVFDHSWSLLNPNEQQTLLCLSVFRSGFTRDAARLVTGTSLLELSGLVNKSLINHDPPTGRLEIHEILRQYAQERLEADLRANISAQEAHAAYFADFMQHRWQDLKGRKQLKALEEVEADIENVRTAWRYYLDQNNVSQLWKFTNGLWYVYWIRWWNHAGMELFGEAVKILQGNQDEEGIALRATTMAFQAYFMSWVGLAEEGLEFARESVEVLKGLNHPNALVIAYDSFLINAYLLHHYSEMKKITDKMFHIAAEIDDKWLLGFTLFASGMSALANEDFKTAKQLAKSHLRLNEEIGDVIGTTFPLIILGHVALVNGEYEEAGGFYSRCLNISNEISFPYGLQTAGKYLGKVNLSLGNFTEAHKHLHQCLRITREIGFVRDIINLLFDYACLRSAQNQYEKAIELLGFVLQHPASSQFRWFEGRICDNANELLGKLERELPPNTFKSALARGRDLELEGLVIHLLENLD